MSTKLMVRTISTLERASRRLTSKGSCVSFIFFFQAEDGIRDLTVTGVQTCALPISRLRDQGAATHEVHDRQAEAEVREAVARDREGSRRTRQVDRARRDAAHARSGPRDRKSVV